MVEQFIDFIELSIRKMELEKVTASLWKTINIIMGYEQSFYIFLILLAWVWLIKNYFLTKEIVEEKTVKEE